MDDRKSDSERIFRELDDATRVINRCTMAIIVTIVLALMVILWALGRSIGLW